MPSPGYSVYEGDTKNGVLPRRPTLADCGGGAKLDDPNFPPDPIQHCTANDFNSLSGLFPAFGRVTPSALLFIHVDGAAAPQVQIITIRAASTLLAAASFVCSYHSTGDMEISCPSTLIIPPAMPVAATQAAGDFRVSARINATGDGIRIETRNSAGAFADANLIVGWF